MGSDMVVAACRDIHHTPAAKRWIDELVLAGTITLRNVDRIDRLVAHERVTTLDLPEHYDDYLFWHEAVQNAESENNEPTFTDEQLREMVRDGIDLIFENYRETTTLYICGKSWLVSGGSTWGDPPTDCYDPINMIDFLGLFDKAFTLAEVKRAARGAVAMVMPS